MTATATALSSAHPPTGHISPLQQWWVLTVRGLTKVLRNGEFIFAFISPAMLALCFYLPLRKAVAEVADINYAQYLMPIIMLQSMAFVASASAMRAALDGQEGVHARFRVLPMPSFVPFLARTVTNAVLLLVALGCGLVACLLMGWRPVSGEEDGGGLAGAVIAVALVAGLGLILSLLADAMGLVAKSPEATSQLVAFPTLILGMLSSGFIPLAMFPSWIRGFVRNQPISQVTKAMREAMDGTLTWQGLAPTLWWCAALIALALVLLAISVRRNAR